MKILIPFLLILLLLCGLFALIDSPGSGMGVTAAVLATLLVAALLYNKLHNGTWFTDSSGGH